MVRRMSERPPLPALTSRPTGPTLTLGLVLALTVTGCAAPPDLRGQASAAARAAPYPSLVPIEGLLAEAAKGRLDADTVAQFEARIAGLQRRGAALRRQMVLTRSERARLEARAARLRPAAPRQAAEIDTRIAELRARAEDLRRQILVTDADRARMEAALARANGS